MPNDNLAPVARNAIATAEGLLNSRGSHPSDRKRVASLLEDVRNQLDRDIEERKSEYPQQLAEGENSAINQLWSKLNSSEANTRLLAEQAATTTRFEELRRINNGEYPRNLSPIIYAVPLLLLGIGEWYINYTTFLFSFVRAIAIVATVLVAITFAFASHMHGHFIKQIAEILHPSVHYRAFMHTKIALVIITVFLFAALGLVLWVRYDLLTAQFGEIESGDVFGAASRSKVFSKLAQTGALNAGIWALGTVYAWYCAEKIPEIREAYRRMLRIDKKVAGIRRPTEKEVERVKSSFNRASTNSQTTAREYKQHSDTIGGLIKQVEKLE